MAGLVELSVQEGGIARIAIRNPPVNALGHSVRAGLIEAFDLAAADDEVRAIVLLAEGRTFPAGADIKEFGATARAPSLSDVCTRIEDCEKPVIAAIHGTALGGGLELALAAHYRIAAPDALVGLPEVTLGLLPGAGGTQRLPRLVGAAAALEMMLIGRPIDAAEASRLGLVERVADGRLRPAAFAYAQDLLASGAGPRRARDCTDGLRDPQGFQAAVAEHRARHLHSPAPAPMKIIECVEVAQLLPFDGGLAFEASAFEDCLQSEQSQALRHLFFAERRAAQVPETATAEGQGNERVAIAGGGELAASLAVACLDGGLSVILAAPSEAGLTETRDHVQQIYMQLMAQLRLPAAKQAERMARLSGGIGLSALMQADYVIAPLPHDARAARTALIPVANALPAETPLGIIAPGQAIGPLVVGCDTPGQIVGLRVAGDPHLQRLFEVVVGPASSAATVASTFKLLKHLGRVAVRQSGGRRSLADRVSAACLHAADFMLVEGATPYQVDAALVDYGFALGPYRRVDREGLEYAGTGAGVLGEALIALGWPGEATGRGYYSYDPKGGAAHEDEDTLLVLEELRREHEITPRAFTAAEIVQRCTAAMANAGAQMIEAGSALRPSDIDVAMVHGAGFPRWRGGPMMAADQAGLLKVQNTLTALTDEDPDFWSPSPLFAELIKNGQHFADLN